jgi:glycosyltransferase involved in cell wall biosynthesis
MVLAMLRPTAALRIAHVNDSLVVGGSEKLTAMLCRQQRSRHQVVSVHCLFLIGRVGEELRDEGFDVVLHHARSALGLMRSLYRAFKLSTPDVVHCHNTTAAVLGALPARLAGVKTIVATRHGLVKPPYQLKSELRFAVASRFCDWVVGVSQSTRTNLLGAPLAARDKIVHVYNGASPANVAAVPRPKPGFTLLHVGRLVVEKDQATMLRAVAIARTKIPGLHLWIVGDGPLGPDLRALRDVLALTDGVTFFGEQGDVSSFLASADLFVMSSTSEGLPMSLLEAMSVGLPAVVTDVGGMGEIARLSGGVMPVRPSDPEAMAKAFCEAALRSHELPQIGQTASRCYEENFTPDAMYQSYMRLYRRPAAHP